MCKEIAENQCCVPGVYNLLCTCYILSAIFTTLVWKIQMTSKGILFIVYIIIRMPLIFKTKFSRRILRKGAWGLDLPPLPNY